MSSNTLTVDQPLESIKKFKFYTEGTADEIEITIPERTIKHGVTKCVTPVASQANQQNFIGSFDLFQLQQPGYSFYGWPAASVLACISFTTLNKRFLWIQRDKFIGKRILEIGCGTALPGILAAKFGAKVILSDSCTFPNALKHASRCCSENNLEPGRDIDVIGLTWGLLLKSVFNIGPLDYIIASDCFYDPSVFEDILVTVSFLLNATSTSQNSAPVKFLFTYQERSSDWSIDHLLQKWRLRCSKVSLKCVKKLCPIDLNELMNNHTIHLLEISKLS